MSDNVKAALAFATLATLVIVACCGAGAYDTHRMASMREACVRAGNSPRECLLLERCQ